MIIQRAVVGTAGHIDHGKTRLVEALTGIDCDRWAEEKARGITIDLGFAHLHEDDLQLGFVDVPGHERFLANALAGLGGIRILLLVVSAEEGVKPQTREHLAIASLLGIPSGLVALTKVDLVEPDLAELAALEIEELLSSTPFAGAEIVPVSSATGEGIPALKTKLLALARAHAVQADPAAPARLPVDRAFLLKGLGLAVTGTLASGVIAVGDELELLPAGQRAKVRSIQVHGEGREQAFAGERTSVRLAGLELADTGRGTELATPGAFAASRTLAARITLLPDAPRALTGFQPVRVHLHTSEALGRMRPLDRPSLAPGETGIVELRLAQPLIAARGDRLVLRRPSPAATVGGGEVIDPAWPRRRGRALAAALAAFAAGPTETLLLWIGEAGAAGATAEELAGRLGGSRAVAARALTALAKDQRILEATPPNASQPRYLLPEAYRRVIRRAEKVLAEHFRRDHLSPGLAKAEAVERIFPGRSAALAEVYLSWLAAQKKIAVEGGRITSPGRRPDLSGEESALETKVLARFEAAGLTPPSPAELRDELKAKPQILDGVMRHLVDKGKLVRLGGGLMIAAGAVAGLKRDLAGTGWQRFGVPTFKDRFGLSRKWAIPLLEYLDGIGATRRVGDERLLVPSRLTKEEQP
ncbi:MAG TPA: selenocysteine-specific translation elongation factor [Thermoanaerobaculia bacterium]|nr:selenocysteine-specific translation elongation factor [Thermoanaerobaculia bacterium]